MVWGYVQQLIDIDLRAIRGPIGRSHVMCELLCMPIGLEDLTRQSYLLGGSNLPSPFDPINEKGLLMLGARWNWV